MPTILAREDGAPAALSFDLNTTLGALEVGIVVALFLSGMVTAQALAYSRRCRSDSRVLKCVVSRFILDALRIFTWLMFNQVGLCWALDLGHSIAICHTLYTITVTQYAQPEALLIPPLSLDTSILLSGFIGPLEQGWFTYRRYRLTKSPLLPLLCMCLTLARFVGIIGLSTIALHAYPLPEYNERAGWLIETVVIISAALDTILATALCYYLSSWRLDKSRVLRKIVNQIMIWTVETGTATILGALGLLVTYLTMKDNCTSLGPPSAAHLKKDVYVGFFVIIPKLFANSLLLSCVLTIVINAREQFSNTIRSNKFRDLDAAQPFDGAQFASSAETFSLIHARFQVAQIEMSSFPSPTASEGGMGILGIRSPGRYFSEDKDRVAFSSMESPTDVYDGP
ncbi:hypothetical protein C8R46DRAFT_1313546 [Mycena filopes]|nr:hypothetical protein C8R46DRAFT_1313546 [Mycena filopes]